MKLEITNEKLQEFNGLLQSLPISHLATVEKITNLINSCVIKEESTSTQSSDPKPIGGGGGGGSARPPKDE